MVNVGDKNMYLINSPAGSGKTTTIKSMITEIITESSKNRVLCITYTNRAADELREGLDSSRIEISTIHSFVDSYFKIYFKDESVLDLYFDIYQGEIQDRILNTEGKEHIKESNERYIDKFGDLSLDIIKENLKELKYNEMPFNSLYTGGLCHNDILIFSKHILNTFPKVKERLRRSYDYVFIDEYQDTTTEVLKLFFEALDNSNTKLILFGDKMQQIYKNYDGSFEDKLVNFDTTNKLLINYRSTQKIIEVLNNVYNDTDYSQSAYDQSDYDDSFIPKIIITDSVDNVLIDETNCQEDSFILFLSNKKRFESIDSLNLYNAVDKMNTYQYGRKYSAVDVLLGGIESQDECIRLLFLIRDLIHDFHENLYGTVIKKIRNNKLFNLELLNINYKNEKMKLKDLLSEILDYYLNNQEKSINEFISYISSTGIIVDEFLVKLLLESEEYQNLFKVKLREFENLNLYLKNPSVSTQHGVKGESHNSVIFIADDSPTLDVAMYKFLEMISNIEINLTGFQNFYFSFQRRIDEINNQIGFELNKINVQQLGEYKEEIVNLLKAIDNDFSCNVYYEELMSDSIRAAITTPQVGKINKIKPSKIFRVLNSYRLFYVGCSRARRKLTVILNESSVSNFKGELIKKMTSFGFRVEER